MDRREFSEARKRLNKTQQEMAQLLGTSVKAVHSYEQGWRNVPAHAERQMIFLLTRRRAVEEGEPEPCWRVKDCPKSLRERCPAWEFSAGTMCWFINGTLCEGEPLRNWKEKMGVCRSCKVLTARM